MQRAPSRKGSKMDKGKLVKIALIVVAALAAIVVLIYAVGAFQAWH